MAGGAHTLHLVRSDDIMTVRAIKAIKEALIGLDGAASLMRARDIARRVSEHGWELIGASHDRADISTAAAVLRRVGLEPRVDTTEDVLTAEVNAGRKLSPEETFAAAEGRPALTVVQAEPEESGPPFPTEAYETALVMMAISNGHPLAAAANARNLMRTTGEPDLYADVIQILVRVFPWMLSEAQANGLL